MEQGNRTVDEYAAEFGRLSQFAEGMVRTPRDRAKRFCQGLVDNIRDLIVANVTDTYSRMLTVAQNIEASLCQKKDRNDGKDPNPRPAKRRESQPKTL